jgi:hypothetical protein
MSKLSLETRQKQRLSKLAEKNPMWRGDKAGYEALHWWVSQRLPKPAKCQKCFLKPPYDLANITGIYTRELINWRYLCRKCHMASDGRFKARGPNGRFVSPKRLKVYSPLFKHPRSQPNFRVYPNIFGDNS